MSKDVQELANELIKIVSRIEEDENKELRRKSDSSIVDKIFREFQKLVEEDEN